MLKKCPRKSALKEKPVGKALVLGSSARGVKAKEAESEKKLVECFLCHGPHRLRKCPRKSVIEGNDRADKEPKKLGSSKGKNCPKQAEVKRKATSELGESSEGLPPKVEVSLSSDLEEKVAMKTVKLGPMRLKLSEVSDSAESSTRLPPMGEVGGASDFKGKEVMHVGQLTRVNAKNVGALSKFLSKEAERLWAKRSQVWSVPFRSRNEDIARMGGGECHGPQFKARDHRTKCIQWRSIVQMGIIWPTRTGPIQSDTGEACQIEAQLAR
ncbi:hypothetical protein Gotur_013087 [Gossypium turneri]